MRDPSNVLLGQADGTFWDVTEAAGLVRFDRGRGAALVDLNLDGRLDIVESFYRAPVTVWRNEPPDAAATPGSWLAVRVRQAGPNADAIGAVVQFTVDGLTQYRELTAGGGHSGGELGWIHLGLGSADAADVKVRWPDGTSSDPVTLRAGTFTTVDREAGAQEWRP
jgi:hypothetical protein